MPYGAACGFIARAAALRNESAALRRGSFSVLRTHGGLIVYERRLGSERLAFALNASDGTEPLPEIGGGALWAEGLCGKELAPWGFAVFGQ